MRSIAQIALKPVLVLSQNTSLHDVALAMCKKEVGCAILSDEMGHITGIVTDRDLTCSSVTKNINPQESIQKVMTTSLIYALEDSFVSEAIELMKFFGIRRVPVLRNLHDGKQHCIGLLTVDDLIMERVISLDDLAEILKNQLLPSTSFQLKKLEENKLRKYAPEFERFI